MIWKSYSGLTVSPDGLCEAAPEYPELPGLPENEPTSRLHQAQPSGDPLEAVEHRRIRQLSAYWHAGWSSAVPVTLLRASTARRLYRVADDLPDEFGLAVFDAWRPLDLQAEIYEAVNAEKELPSGYFAAPRTDPLRPPPHSTGGAVDLTLTIAGAPLALGSSFDEFSPVSHLGAFEGRQSLIRDLRRMLYWIMHDQGFVGIRTEWWHYEFGTVRWAARSGKSGLYGRVANRGSSSCA